MPSMAKSSIKSVREQFGEYLKKHRENVLGEKNLLLFSYDSKLDNSKLRKIEMGQINIRFDTLLEIVRCYKLDKVLFGFTPIIDD